MYHIYVWTEQGDVRYCKSVPDRAKVEIALKELQSLGFGCEYIAW